MFSHGCFLHSSVKVLLAEHKKSGKLYAIKALKKADVVSRDEVDRWVISGKQLEVQLTSLTVRNMSEENEVCDALQSHEDHYDSGGKRETSEPPGSF